MSSPARPLIFIEKIKGASRVVACDAAAVANGLEPGLSLADARARIPALKAVAQDVAADQAFLVHLAGIAYAFTPSVAFDAPDGLVLDVTGCAHLFGGEAELAVRLEKTLRKAGVSIVMLAIAPTPEMARALARFAAAEKGLRPARGTGPSRSPSRGRPLDPFIVHDSKHVRALSVAALEGEPEDIRALKRAGLKTIGDIASRPSILFSARFTPAFMQRLPRILGEEDRRITSLHPPPETALDHRCPEPLVTADAILPILGTLLAETVRLLDARGEGARLLEAAFFRTDGLIRRIRIETSRPLRDPAIALRLFQDRLDALADPLDPGFGFDLIRLEVLRAEPWAPEQASLDANAERAEEMARLVDRLGAIFGRERIMRLRAADTHLPERAQQLYPAADGGRNGEGHGGGNPGHHMASYSSLSSPGDPIARPLHLFARPQPIEVELRSWRSWGQTHGSDPTAASGDVMLRFRWRRVVHDITRAEGPERIAEEWWHQPSGYGTRDYYRVETCDGRRFWMFRAHADRAEDTSGAETAERKNSKDHSVGSSAGHDKPRGPSSVTSATERGAPSALRSAPVLRLQSATAGAQWFLYGVFA